MSEDQTPAIRERLAAATDDIGLQYSVAANEWLLSCDKPTMQLLRHAPEDITWLLGEVERLRAENVVAVQHQREASQAIRSVEGLRKERDDALAAVDAVRNELPWWLSGKRPHVDGAVLALTIQQRLTTHLPDDTKEEPPVKCTFCDEARDDLSVGSDGTTTACADCMSAADDTKEA